MITLKGIMELKVKYEVTNFLPPKKDTELFFKCPECGGCVVLEMYKWNQAFCGCTEWKIRISAVGVDLNQ